MTLVSRRARARARAGLRRPPRGRLPLRRLPDRLPHPQPAARPLRRGGPLRRLRARSTPATQKEGGREAAFALANRVLTLLAVAAGGASSCWRSSSPGRSSPALAPGFDDAPGKAELTVLLTRVMMPFLPLVSFAAVAMGMLNAEERFGIPALSPALFNVVAILWAVVLWSLGLPLDQVVVGWALGTLLGGRRPVRGAGPLAAAAGMALPARVGAARPGPRPDGPAHGPGHGRPGRRAGQHLRQQPLRLPRARGRVLAGLRVPPALPAHRPLRRGARHHRDARASRGAPPRATWRACATRCGSRSRCWPT